MGGGVEVFVRVFSCFCHDDVAQVDHGRDGGGCQGGLAGEWNLSHHIRLWTGALEDTDHWRQSESYRHYEMKRETHFYFIILIMYYQLTSATD